MGICAKRATAVVLGGALLVGSTWFVPYALPAPPSAPPPDLLTRPSRVFSHETGTLQSFYPVYQVLYIRQGALLVSVALNEDPSRPRPRSEVKFWNVAKGQLMRTMAGGYRVAISPDGRFCAVASFDGTPKGICTLKVLRTSDLSVAAVLHPSGTVEDLTFSPDGTMLGMNITDHVPYTELWNVRTQHSLIGPKGTAKKFQPLADEEAQFQGFSPDSKLLRVFGDRDLIEFWSLRTGQTVKKFVPNFHTFGYPTFSPDGKLVAGIERGAKDYPASVVLYDASSGHKLKTLRYPHVVPFPGSIGTQFTFSPNTHSLVVVCHLGAGSGAAETVQLWDLAHNRLVATFQDKDKDWSGTAPRYQFTSDSKFLLATGGDLPRRLKIRDARSGQLTHTLQGKAGDFVSYTSSPDESTLAAGGIDGKIRLWPLR